MQKKVDVRAFLRQHWLWCATILLIALSRFCWYAIQVPYEVYPDSTLYIAFDTQAVLQGNIAAAQGRPPLYGMFLDAMTLLLGEGSMPAVTMVQTALSLVSLVVFAKLLHEIGVRSPWCQVCTFLYGVSPAVVGWDNAILTESFSLSGAIVFFYWILLYIWRHQVRYGVLALCLAALLTFLRPQFQVYLALLTVFLLLKLIFPFDRAERRKLLVLLAVQAALWGGVLGYSWLHQQYTGIFSLTTALPVQNVRLCIDRGYYKDFDDTEMAEFIARRLEETKDLSAADSAMEAGNSALAEFGYARAGDTAQRYLASHFAQNLSDTAEIILNGLSESFCGYGLYARKLDPTARGIFFKAYHVQMALFGWLTIAHALLASALEGIAMVAVWIKRRTMPWLHMALFSISVCTTFLTYFVTCGEYMRTMISILPYFFCMAGLFLQMCSDYAARVRAAQPAHPQ